jgi:hypothetical protein
MDPKQNVSSTLTSPKTKINKIAVIIIVSSLVVIVFITVIFLLVYKPTNSKPAGQESNRTTITTSNKVESTIASSPIEISIPTPKNLAKIAFFKKDPNAEYNPEDKIIWMINQDGSDLHNSGLRAVEMKYNAKGNVIAYKQRIDSINQLHVYLIDSKKTIDIEEKDVVEAEANISNNFDLSSTGKYLIYSIQYQKKGYNSESGPMEIDPYPVAKNGYYSYELNTGKRTYLGHFSNVNNYDAGGENIYVQPGDTYLKESYSDGYYKINLSTGESKKMDPKPKDYFDTAFYLEEQKIKIKVVDNFKPNPKMILVKDGKETVIDTGEFLNAREPFISEDRNVLLYEKLNHKVIGGTNKPTYSYYDWIEFDLTTMKSKKVFESDTNDKRCRELAWISPHEYMLVVDKENNKQEVQSGDFVYVNTETGESKAITTTGDVLTVEQF